MKSFFNSETFGDLTKVVQIAFDKASENQKQLFSNSFVDELFDWDIPQYGLTFQELIGKYQLTMLASIIGDSAATPLRAVDGASVYTGEIPRIGHKYVMQANKVRELLQMLETTRITDKVKMQKLQDTMFANVGEAVKGVKDRLDHIILQALSNDGVAAFTATNNPDGRRFSIDYLMPATNKRKCSVVWSIANLATADPFTDIANVVNAYKGKIEFGKILMSNETMLLFTRFTTVKKALFGTDKAATPLMLPYLNEQMQRYGMPIIEVVNKQNAVLVNGARTVVNPWNAERIAFIPAGKIGTVKTAFEDSQIMPETGVSYSTYDRGNIVVSQWMTGDSKGEATAEFTQASTRAVPVITAIDGIVSLDIATAAS